MATPALTVAEVRLKGLANDQQCMTVLHYSLLGGSVLNPGGAIEESLADAIVPGGGFDIVTAYLDCISPQYLLQAVDVQLVALDRWANFSENFALPGTYGGDLNAQNVSAYLFKRFARAGRMFKGGVHLPGIAEDSYALGKITGGMQAKMGVLATKLVSAVTTAATDVWVPVIWHRNLAPDPFPKVDQVRFIIAQDTLRTMRRRTIGIGK